MTKEKEGGIRCFSCSDGHGLVIFSSHGSGCLLMMDAVNSQSMVVEETRCSVICCPAFLSHMEL